jgi:hypothetical protein
LDGGLPAVVSRRRIEVRAGGALSELGSIRPANHRFLNVNGIYLVFFDRVH